MNSEVSFVGPNCGDLEVAVVDGDRSVFEPPSTDGAGGVASAIVSHDVVRAYSDADYEVL